MSQRPHFLVALLAVLAPVAPALGADGKDRDALQDLLARLRKNRAAVVSNLKGDVDAVLASLLEAAQERDLDALEAGGKRLAAFGPESALLLVEHIDPGLQANDAEKLRSQCVMVALASLRSRAITTRLVEIVQSGSAEGRANAVLVLGHSPEPERAGPVLAGVFRTGEGPLRQAALVALARLGGEASDSVLEEALADTRPEITSAAIAAMAQAKKAAFAPRILKILQAQGAAQHQVALLAYYRALPEIVDKAIVSAWVRISGEPPIGQNERQQIFAFLAQNAEKIDSDARKNLRQLSQSPTREISEGALIVLVVAGDRNARKDLFDPYDQAIERNKEWPAAYSARGEINYRVGDYTSAISDFKRALQLAADDLNVPLDQTYIGLARAYAMAKRVNDAGTTLEKAPLTQKQLAQLRNDPALAKVVEHPRFRHLFEAK